MGASCCWREGGVVSLNDAVLGDSFMGSLKPQAQGTCGMVTAGWEIYQAPTWCPFLGHIKPNPGSFIFRAIPVSRNSPSSPKAP